MEITQLLDKVSSGDKEAYNTLFPMVYEKLRLLAQNQLNLEYSNHTLCKTELVHEAYEKMVGQPDDNYDNRSHFFAIAARSMRQILVDYARKKKAQKRGGDRSRITLDEQKIRIEDHAEQLLDLDQLLEQMKKVDERMHSVVELRFFGGLSIEETAKMLGISSSTANRDWIKARGWLYQHLHQNE